jgi:putative FmdB family regulatory protein
MPIYEYACAKCGELTEVLAKVDDAPPAKCPHCGAKKLSRVVSRSSFQLKGGGWYSDLYGSKKPSSPEPAKPKPEKAAKVEKAGTKSGGTTK